MPTIIAMQDIRTSLAAISRRVATGESFIVVRNSRPAFRIEPVEQNPPFPATRFEDVAGSLHDRGPPKAGKDIRKNGPRRVAPLHPGAWDVRRDFDDPLTEEFLTSRS